MQESSVLANRWVSENRELRSRLEAAEETLRAIRANEVDAVMIREGDSEKVCTLRGADQAYRTFVEVMSQGAATLAADGSVLYCNRHFADLLASPLDRTVGSSIYEFVAPEDEGALRALLWEGLAAPCVAKSFRLRRRDGSPISTVLTATPLNAEGVASVCLVVTDLTDRDARIAAEAANRAKDRFLAVLSHELRTPLTPVVMMAAALQYDSRLPPDVREDLEMIRRNVELETRLIDDLLDVSRVITGKLRLRPAPVGLRGLVESVMEMVKSDLNQKSLDVRYEWLADSDRVNGDSARIQQVIWNVVKNAIKFSTQSGVIEVRLTNPDQRTVRLEVRDHGIGIDSAVLPLIFNAFEQGDATVARQAGGLGLGLSIARSVVEMHGGAIRAQSQGLGRGTTLMITLPLTSLPGAAAAEHDGDGESTRGVGADGPGVRVLLVEDHHETATVLARLLRHYGHDVKVAESMKSALELASSAGFDLVISDIGLPDGTGLDLMKQIKQRHGIPGVALTGYGMEEDLAKSAEVGFAEHVVKPVDIPHLQSVITRVVGRGR